VQSAGGTLLGAGTTLAVARSVDLQGGTLSGTGTVNGDVRNAGTVLVGDSVTVGVLTITGTYVQSASGTLLLKVGGTHPGTDSDALVVGSTATLDGTLNLTLINGYVPASGASLTPLTSSAEDGVFAALAGDGGLYAAFYNPTGVTLTAN
jgi:hypothetical protein